MVLKKERIVIISSILLTFVPIFNIYRVNLLSIGLGDIALFLIMLSSLIINKGRIRSIEKHYFVIYYIFFFILALFSMLILIRGDMADFASKWIRLIVYVFIFDVMAKTEFDIRILYKWAVLLGLMVSTVLLIQVLFNTVFSIQLMPYFDLGWISVNYGEANLGSVIQVFRLQNTFGAWRASSIFQEPAIFAQFTLLSLVVSVFWGKDFVRDKKRILCSIIITLAILMSRSANGIFIAILIWTIYILRLLKKRLTADRILLVVIILLAAVIIFLRTGYLSDAWERVQTLDMGGGGSTGNLRLMQGFAIFNQLPPFAKWFGIGFGNLEAYLMENHITTSFLKDIGNEYMNGFSTVLVSSGIVGLMIFLIIWIRLFFENRSSVSRVLFIVISVLFCTSSLFYSCITVVYLVLIRCWNDTAKNRKLV